MVKLRELRIEDMPTILRWRHECIDTLRTSSFLTLEQQEQWYKDVVCNRFANARFWAIENENHDLIGYCGLENIQWENSIAEVSLLIDPRFHKCGYGMSAFIDMVALARDMLNLHTIYAECYANNPALSFWRKAFDSFFGIAVILPNRKYCHGEYFDSYYFSMSFDA